MATDANHFHFKRDTSASSRKSSTYGKEIASVTRFRLKILGVGGAGGQL